MQIFLTFQGCILNAYVLYIQVIYRHTYHNKHRYDSTLTNTTHNHLTNNKTVQYIQTKSSQINRTTAEAMNYTVNKSTVVLPFFPDPIMGVNGRREVLWVIWAIILRYNDTKQSFVFTGKLLFCCETMCLLENYVSN